MRTFCAFGLGLVLWGAAACDAGADGVVCTLPKGTRVTIRLQQAVSSSKSRTGEPFAFWLAAPIAAPSCTIPPEGAEGLGTIYLAGASGSAGHEGDLTLRLDSIHTFDGHYVVFDDQRMRINGKNRKIESTVLGFIPYAGLASGFIRGSDVHLDAGASIDTVLDRPATFTDIAPPPPSPVPGRKPSPSPSPMQSLLPSPLSSPEPFPSQTPLPAQSPSPAPSPLPAPTTTP